MANGLPGARPEHNCEMHSVFSGSFLPLIKQPFPGALVLPALGNAVDFSWPSPHTRFPTLLSGVNPQKAPGLGVHSGPKPKRRNVRHPVTQLRGTPPTAALWFT